MLRHAVYRHNLGIFSQICYSCQRCDVFICTFLQKKKGKRKEKERGQPFDGLDDAKKKTRKKKTRKKKNTSKNVTTLKIRKKKDFVFGILKRYFLEIYLRFFVAIFSCFLFGFFGFGVFATTFTQHKTSCNHERLFFFHFLCDRKNLSSK